MNTIDTRDLQKEFNELHTDYEALKDELETLLLDDDDLLDAEEELKNWETDNLERYEALQELFSELKSCSEFQYGITLIDEDDFTAYTQEYAEDIGAVGESSHWIAIDWDATAENLRSDFDEVEFEGTTYLYR